MTVLKDKSVLYKSDLSQAVTLISVMIMRQIQAHYFIYLQAHRRLQLVFICSVGRNTSRECYLQEVQL